MMEVYDQYRLSSLYFVIFIVLATFFMMNLFTAAAYLKYQEVEQGFEKDAVGMTERHLGKAFDMLDFNHSNDLDRDELLQVVAELRKAHLLPGIAQVRSHTVLSYPQLPSNTHSYPQLPILACIWRSRGRATLVRCSSAQRARAACAELAWKV